MKYINNWDKIMDRMIALMNQEILDRCCVSVKARTGSLDQKFNNYLKDEKDLLKYWTDGEFLLNKFRDECANTHFAGDAFPNMFTNFGVSAHAAYFKNANYKFKPNTMWFFPTIEDWDETPLELDDKDFYYNKVIEAYKYLADNMKGDAIISSTDMCGNADGLAHLRGSENLMMDFLVEKEMLKKGLESFETQYERTHRNTFEIVKENNYGGFSIGWMNLWAPGIMAQMQCDLSVMISKESFDEFIMPELIAQTNFLDYSVYHLDGVEQIRHLDSILSLEKLNLIQWTHVDGQPAPYEYLDTLKRIQDAGKSLIIFTNPKEYKIYLENLSSKGLILYLETDTADEADYIVKQVEKLTKE